jgi:hypothetical protein
MVEKNQHQMPLRRANVAAEAALGDANRLANEAEDALDQANPVQIRQVRAREAQTEKEIAEARIRMVTESEAGQQQQIEQSLEQLADAAGEIGGLREDLQQPKQVR